MQLLMCQNLTLGTSGLPSINKELQFIDCRLVCVCVYIHACMKIYCRVMLRLHSQSHGKLLWGMAPAQKADVLWFVFSQSMISLQTEFSNSGAV